VKIFGFHLALIILLTGLILAVVFNVIHNHYFSQISKDLLKLNHNILLIAQPLYEKGENTALDSLLKAIRGTLQSRITIIDINWSRYCGF